MLNVQNYGLLNAKPTEPSGYVTKDGMWAAVPWGKRFVIIHNGEQVHETASLKTAKDYITKQIKVTKPKKTSSSSSLEQFL
jgi:hypothetical protein